MAMTQAELVTLARLKAQEHGLDPALVCAVVEQESSWNPNATRFEPAFKIRYIDPLGLSEPEATYRATSYGLLQIMGEVAREFGFTEDIPTLCDPATGLEWGCRKLAHEVKHYPGALSAALSAYNGGGNSSYAPQVLARVAKYQSAPEAKWPLE